MNYKKELNNILDKFNFTKKDKEYLINIIYPIFINPEFQKRLDYNLYPHHNLTSLGMHILMVTILTYKYILKYNPKVNKKLTILIAMFHDLYEIPWQNNNTHKNKIINLHGFMHPIEACINAYTWFPKYFNKIVDCQIIIDGIIHHMYPFPVRTIDNTDLELNNIKKYNNIPNYIKNIIIDSTKRNKVLQLSYCKSKYKEGRIVSIMDKKTTIIQDNLSFMGLLALVTGKNKNIKKN